MGILAITINGFRLLQVQSIRLHIDLHIKKVNARYVGRPLSTEKDNMDRIMCVADRGADISSGTSRRGGKGRCQNQLDCWVGILD